MAPNKKIKSLTSFVGTHTRGLLRIIAHAPEKVRGSDLDFRHLKSSMSTIGC